MGHAFFPSAISREDETTRYIMYRILDISDFPVPSHLSEKRAHLWTLRRLLTYRLSIITPPRRHFFKLASFFTTSELEREKFQEFASRDGQDELQSYCHRPKRTALEVFRDFPNTKPPPEYAFDFFPELKPRQVKIPLVRWKQFQKLVVCTA